VFSDQLGKRILAPGLRPHYQSVFDSFHVTIRPSGKHLYRGYRSVGDLLFKLCRG
jgi:hypothetical protein